MLEDGVIEGFSAKLKPQKLGFELTAVVGIRVRGGKLVDVEESLAKRKEVLCVYDVTGEYDAVLITRFKNRGELNDFIKAVLNHPYVERTVTHVVLNTVKEKFTLFV